MSEADALLAAIRQAPDDDAPRLIYADWLDEHGQPERAEFIRVQIELARQDSPEVRKKESELLEEHHDLFAGELAAPGLRYVFERGFIVTFSHTGVYSARRPGSRGDVTSYFRFYSDGHMIHDEARSEDAVFPNRLRRDEGRLRENQYVLQTIVPPFEIRFDCFQDDRQPVLSFHGTFGGPTWSWNAGNTEGSKISD